MSLIFSSPVSADPPSRDADPQATKGYRYTMPNGDPGWVYPFPGSLWATLEEADLPYKLDDDPSPMVILDVEGWLIVCDLASRAVEKDVNVAIADSGYSVGAVFRPNGTFTVYEASAAPAPFEDWISWQTFSREDLPMLMNAITDAMEAE